MRSTTTSCSMGARLQKEEKGVGAGAVEGGGVHNLSKNVLYGVLDLVVMEKKKMEREVVEAELVLPTHLGFKRIQMYEKYPKGQSRGRHWKHLKQILQAENYQNYPPDEPNYINIESPPSMHPCKRICDITGYEAPYYDPRTNLRYANADVFKLVRSLPNEYVQRYLALRNAAVVLK